MNLREIADAIEQTKAGYFAEIVGDVDKAKSEVWEIAHDSTRSTDWVKEQTDKAIERFNADRKAKAEAVAAKLEELYQNGLDAAADVFAKQPTAGELAYLQAFSMKERITKTDVDSALRSLRHSAVASAAVCERATNFGVKCEKSVPGYIAVAGVHDECLDAARASLRLTATPCVRVRVLKWPFRPTPFARRCGRSTWRTISRTRFAPSLSSNSRRYGS